MLGCLGQAMAALTWPSCSISRVLDALPMRDELRSFLTRAADYTLTPLPAMLRLATRTPGLGAAPGTRRIYRLAGPAPNKADRRGRA